jgi:hypothetical protein
LTGPNGAQATIDGSGNQNVNCTIGCTASVNGSVGTTGAAVPASATYVGITSGGNLIGWNGNIGNTGFNITGTLPAFAATPTVNIGTAPTIAVTIASLPSGAVTNAGTFAVQAAQSGTWNIGTVTTLPALPANQSTNVAQMNGVTTSMNTGASDTGTQRIAIAQPAAGVNTGVGNIGLLGTGTQVSATSGDVANASAQACLAAHVGAVTYITSFSITGDGSTAGSVVAATLNTIGGNLTYDVTFPAGVSTQITPVIVNFITPIPAGAANTATCITLAAGGTGNLHAAVNITGFWQ